MMIFVAVVGLYAASLFVENVIPTDQHWRFKLLVGCLMLAVIIAGFRYRTGTPKK